MADGEIEWFQTMSSRVWGVLCVALAVVVIVFSLADGAFPVALGAVVFALLAYASMLRPKVGLTTADLVMRNMYTTVVIPLPAIDTAVVSRTFSARVIDRDYISPALGRTIRQSVRARTRPSDPLNNYADLVEQRIAAKIADARALTGVRQGSTEQVKLADAVVRRWSWPELGALGVVVVAFVGSIAL